MVTQKSYPVLWRRSTRARRLALRIDPVARQVIVTIPPSVSLRRAEAFLDAHDDWARTHLAALPSPPSLMPGSRIWFDNRFVTLAHTPEHAQTARLNETHLSLNGPLPRFGNRAVLFLKHQAGLILPAELAHEATRMACTVTRFACSAARTRWGSCTKQGRIMLNWRLIMMPEAVRRYVMVHELAHLTHFDHSRAFWAMVDRHHPARKQAQSWLKEHGTTLLTLG